MPTRGRNDWFRTHAATKRPIKRPGSRPALTIIRFRGGRRSRPAEAAMAMLVLHAPPPRADLVAPDLAPRRRIFRIAFDMTLHAVATGDRGRCNRIRHLVFAVQRIDLLRFHIRKLQLLIFRRSL